MDIFDKQQATYQVLIDRFGPEIGLSSDLYKKVANGTASKAENIEYQASRLPDRKSAKILSRNRYC